MKICDLTVQLFGVSNIFTSICFQAFQEMRKNIWLTEEKKEGMRQKTHFLNVL